VVAAIAMNTRAIEMGQARRQAQALGRGRGPKAVELGAASRLEGISGSTAGVIVALRRSHATRKQAGGRLRLEAARHEAERLIEQPPAIEPHGFDGFPHREVTPCRVVLGGLVENVTQTKFVTHARHTPAMSEDLRTGQWRLWRAVRAVRIAHRLLLGRGD
jgi:hypothetical protein